MFDNLRDQAKASPFYEDEAKFQQASGTVAPPTRRNSSTRLLGMTAPQRFLLSMMLMVMVCVMGIMALLIAGKLVIY
jgi:hypothetical protein